MYRVISSFHLFQACGSSLGFPKSKLLGGLSWEIDRSAAALVLGVPSVLSGILFDESHFWHHVTSRKTINDNTRDFTSHTCRLRKVTWCNTTLLLQTWNYTLCYDADKLQQTEKKFQLPCDNHVFRGGLQRKCLFFLWKAMGKRVHFNLLHQISKIWRAANTCIRKNPLME